jgi:hypothetical protein
MSISLPFSRSKFRVTAPTRSTILHSNLLLPGSAMGNLPKREAHLLISATDHDFSRSIEPYLPSPSAARQRCVDRTEDGKRRRFLCWPMSWSGEPDSTSPEHGPDGYRFPLTTHERSRRIIKSIREECRTTPTWRKSRAKDIRQRTFGQGHLSVRNLPQDLA